MKQALSLFIAPLCAHEYFMSKWRNSSIMDRRRFMKAIGAGLTFPSAFLKALSQNSDLQSGLVEGSIFNGWGDLVEFKKSTCSTCLCRKGPDCNIYCARDYCRSPSEPDKDILICYLNGERVNNPIRIPLNKWSQVVLCD